MTVVQVTGELAMPRESSWRTGSRGIRWSVILVVMMTVSHGCDSDEPLGDTDPVAPGVRKGLALSPEGFPLVWDNLIEFLTEVGGMPNSAVMWNGSWRDDTAGGTDAGEIPEGAEMVSQSSPLYGFTPISVFGWRSGETLYLNVPDDDTNDWTNSAARALFEGMLVDFVETYEPPYLFLGNESNMYYETDPADYLNWIDFYNTAYDAVKAASPSTMVGPVFNFEHMAGSGALNGWTVTYWEALDLHDLAKVDLVGVTLYPFLNFEQAEDVPATYLDPLISRIGSKPIAITETGWPAEDLGSLTIVWEQSEAAQVTYLSRLEAMLEGKDVELVTWLFLHPMVDPGGSPVEWELFGSISLRDSSGDKRDVYDPWITYSP